MGIGTWRKWEGALLVSGGKYVMSTRSYVKTGSEPAAFSAYFRNSKRVTGPGVSWEMGKTETLQPLWRRGFCSAMESPEEGVTCLGHSFTRSRWLLCWAGTSGRRGQKQPDTSEGGGNNPGHRLPGLGLERHRSGPVVAQLTCYADGFTWVWEKEGSE